MPPTSCWCSHSFLLHGSCLLSHGLCAHEQLMDSHFLMRQALRHPRKSSDYSRAHRMPDGSAGAYAWTMQERRCQACSSYCWPTRWSPRSTLLHGYVRSLMNALVAASAWNPAAAFMDLNSNVLSTNLRDHGCINIVNYNYHKIKTSQGCFWSIIIFNLKRPKLEKKSFPKRSISNWNLIEKSCFWELRKATPLERCPPHK